MERRDLLALSLVPPFSMVDVVRLDALLRKVPYGVRSFESGDTVAIAGSEYPSLLCLLEGSVRAVMNGADGRALTVETFEAPVAIASAVLFAEEPALPVGIEAMALCRVLSLGKGTILDLCGADRAFLSAFLAETGNKLRLLSDKLRSLQFNSIRQKMASYLVTRAKGGRSVKLPYSKEALAELLGVTRPSLSRELSGMAREGLIAVRGREITMLRPEDIGSIVSEA
jgi:CRP-like cAMP-binding protein